jgi:hypothetical protein
MRMLEAFILGVPIAFLKKIQYAWLGAVFFWTWPPVFSSILLGIVVAGLLMMAWQQRAWEAGIKREHHSGGTKLYIDHPHAARTFQIRNLVLVLVGSGLLGWLLNGQVGISGLQWSILFAGFMLLYKDTVLFGATVTYLITDQGIGIRYVPGQVDYRMFFRFNEIWQVLRTEVPERVPSRWDVLTPQRHPKEGILLYALRREGFSKQIKSEVLLSPTDMGLFLQTLAGHVAVTETLSSSSG